MADREIAGRCTCPICGAPAQDVRVNVNQKLYCYCDNGCSFKFNSAQSRKFLPELRAGRNVVTETKTVITSTSRKEKQENVKIENIAGRVAEHSTENTGSVTRTAATGNNTGGVTGSFGGVAAGRRPEFSAGINAGNSEPKRGIFAAWLADDDDD